MKTEDLGKIFEKSICLLYNIPYNSKFNYSISKALLLSLRIAKLKNIFPYDLYHSAKNGNRYDFINYTHNIKLHAKTTKKQAKICPQVIGQPTKETFCKFFKIDQYQIKNYITNNIHYLLDNYTYYTFDHPIIYYNEYKNLLLFVKLNKDIKWNNYKITFTHIINNKVWNESTTIKIDNTTIGSFQIHKNRNCIKFRWNFEKILHLFNDHFDITNL